MLKKLHFWSDKASLIPIHWLNQIDNPRWSHSEHYISTVLIIIIIFLFFIVIKLTSDCNHDHQLIILVPGYYHHQFNGDHCLIIMTSLLKISLQSHTCSTNFDKIILSHLGAHQGTTWSPNVCLAQLRQSLTSVSVSAECYEVYKRYNSAECYFSYKCLVANRTSVSIVCLRLGTISHCAPFDIQPKITTIITTTIVHHHHHHHPEPFPITWATIIIGSWKYHN